MLTSSAPQDETLQTTASQTAADGKLAGCITAPGARDLKAENRIVPSADDHRLNSIALKPSTLHTYELSLRTADGYSARGMQ